MAIPVEGLAFRGEDDTDGEPVAIQRAASEECLSKSQEDMVDNGVKITSPTPEPPRRRKKQFITSLQMSKCRWA